jgi:PEP-CTERM motif
VVLGAGFVITSVSVYVDGNLQSTTGDTLLFIANGAGLSLLDATSGFGLDWIDPSSGTSGQLYSGLESNPTFIPGTYCGTDPFNLDANGNALNASLSISTPEPSSLLMLLAGLLVFVGVLAVRKA